MKKIILALLLCIGTWVSAQQFKLEGIVKSDSGQVLEMANLIVMQRADSAMAGFGFTNVKGYFKIDLNQGVEYILRISYLGFKTNDIIISAQNQKTFFQEVIMVKEDQYLNEVQLVEEMPIMISGDTISYQAEAFNTGNEKKLEDVLENLPGFEVDDNGEVTVEGKTVEKVMVEGKDFFDGDTKVATKNIPANAIEKVQVLRNYNDVSPLNGVTDNDDRIALNIKLKEGKKNIFFGDVAAEVGLDDRYLVHPNLFYYSPKATFNFIGDANNIGRPAFTPRDYFRFTGGFRGMNSKSGSVLRIANDMGGSMQQTNRSVEYESQFGALNFSYNPSKPWTISGFMIASNTEVDNVSRTLNNYIGQDSIANQEVLTTNELSEDRSVLGKLSVKYTPNTKIHFAYDAFTKYAETEAVQDQVSEFLVSNREIRSTNAQQPFSINQNLEFYYDISENSIVSFEGQHLYKKQDPLLKLLSNTKPNFELIPILDSTITALDQSRLITTNKLDGIFNYYYIINNRNHIEFTLGGSLSNQTLESGLQQLYGDNVIDFNDTNLLNDVNFRLSDVYAGIHYKTRINKLTIKPGVNFHKYQTTDEQWGNVVENDWNIALPDLLVKYDFKKSESLTLKYNMQASFTDVNNAALGVILQSYNSLFSGNRYLDNALYHNVNLTYFSFNMFNFTNIFAGLSYSKKIDEIINAVRYVGIDRVNSPINSLDANDLYSGWASYQRRIKKIKITLRANLNYGLTNNRVNDLENTNVSFTQNYVFEFGTNFKKVPNVDVGYRLTANEYTGTNVYTHYANHQPFIKLEAPFGGFLFNAEYSYNSYKANNGPSSIYDFLEARLEYRLPSEKWEFYVNATNLLNTEFIRQDSFNNSVTTTSEIYVLPRYVTLGVKFNI